MGYSYDTAFLPKYRRRVLHNELRQDAETAFRSLAKQKGCLIEEEHLQVDHALVRHAVPVESSYELCSAGGVPPRG